MPRAATCRHFSTRQDKNWRYLPRSFNQGDRAYLDPDHPSNDVPQLRWRQFEGDCKNFLSRSENWAERAARLAGTRWLYSVVRPSGPSTISVAPASYGPSTAAGFLSCIATGQ
jgi:hypothetical protein